MPGRTQDEEQPLLHTARQNGHATHHLTYLGTKDTTLRQWTKTWLQSDIDTQYTDLILIVGFFLAGLLDSGAYNAYTCFTQMMTGNTVFAALGISDLPVTTSEYSWTKSVTSITAFCTGAIVFSTFHHKCGQRKRWTLLVSSLIQSLMVTSAALMVMYELSSESPAKDLEPWWLGFPKDPGFPWLDLVPIALLSFQASGKLLLSRLVEFNMLPTVVLSTLYVDLLSDPSFFTGGLFQHGKRNRRLGGALFYFAGAVVGGACAKGKAGFTGALWLAATINLCISAAWLFWREKQEDEEEDT